MKKLEVSPTCLWAYYVTTPTENTDPSLAPSGSSLSAIRSVSGISDVKSVRSVNAVGVSGAKSVDSIGVSGGQSVGFVGSGVSGGAKRASDGVGAVRSVLASHCKQLLVLQDDALIWTASLPHSAVHLTTASFK